MDRDKTDVSNDSFIIYPNGEDYGMYYDQYIIKNPEEILITQTESI
jgi:hypothetical protein